MYNKKTNELEKKLESVHPSGIKDFVADNEEELMTGNRDFMNYINELIRQKKLFKRDVFLDADISLGYGSKLLTGEKNTRSRDVILKICYAAGFNLEETQRALKLYPMDILYVRNKRDALIMACFNNRPGDIFDLNNVLESNGEEPL
ncbi:MAG: hypothetical protein K6E53_01785 [Lachnospiraceae bacterium]|nr:hypothetical protein [Lachnospiraceae bacterium]